MKRMLSFFAAALLLTGCSTSVKDQTAYIRKVDPTQFLMLQVSDNSKFTDALPAGRYELSVDDDTAGSNPARYSLYLSDQEYDSMSDELEEDLINTLGPGQDLEVTFKDGQFLYIASTSNKTGSYEEGLTGSLEIESEN